MLYAFGVMLVFVLIAHLWPRLFLGFTTGSRAIPLGTYDRATYRKFRENHKVPAAFTLLELALRLAPAPVEMSAQGLVAHVQLLVQKIPDELSGAVARLDIERLEQTVTFLERWWTELEGKSPDLEAISKSGFFQITLGERALFRFSLETRLVAEVFPSVSAETDDIRGRIDSLQKRSEDGIRALLRKRSDEEWASMLRTLS